MGMGEEEDGSGIRKRKSVSSLLMSIWSLRPTIPATLIPLSDLLPLESPHDPLLVIGSFPRLPRV